MQTQRSSGARRPPGTGALIIRPDKAGRETWYGKWRVGERQVKRKLGPRREPGSTVGLTRRQAEAALRREIDRERSRPPLHESLSFAEVAERHLHHVEHVLERKRSTVHDYRIIVRRHLSPFFAGKRIDGIDPDLVAAYGQAKKREGLSTKTVANHLSLLHAIFAHAAKRRWARENPVQAVDRPRSSGADPDIHALDREELEALIRAVPDDLLGPTDRVLYLAAATIGLRQGELVALRWRDVDWATGVVRVRRSYSRGEFGTPKSRRSTRAVPLPDRLAIDLEHHFRRSQYQGDDDLVFPHPLTGRPYDASKIRKRFKDAVQVAGLREVRFHDLRHTFGTRMAAAGAPLRFIQEWMGHRDYKTTSIYADYAPDPSHGAAYAAAAFAVPPPQVPRSSQDTGGAERPAGAV
jgi:integrase